MGGGGEKNGVDNNAKQQQQTWRNRMPATDTPAAGQ